MIPSQTSKIAAIARLYRRDVLKGKKSPVKKVKKTSHEEKMAKRIAKARCPETRLEKCDAKGKACHVSKTGKYTCVREEKAAQEERGRVRRAAAAAKKAAKVTHKDEKLQALLKKLAAVKVVKMGGVSKRCTPQKEKKCAALGKECHISPKGRKMCRKSAADIIATRRAAAKKAAEKKKATSKVIALIKKKRTAAKKAASPARFSSSPVLVAKAKKSTSPVAKKSTSPVAKKSTSPARFSASPVLVAKAKKSSSPKAKKSTSPVAKKSSSPKVAAPRRSGRATHKPERFQFKFF